MSRNKINWPKPQIPNRPTCQEKKRQGKESNPEIGLHAKQKLKTALNFLYFLYFYINIDDE